MKNKLKTYNQFINESVRDFLKPKSTEEIFKNLGNLTPNEMLKRSAKNGFIEGVKIALEKGADPSVWANYAIRYSSQYGHLEIVKLLLEDPRVDPSEDNNYAIRSAAYNDYIEVVKLLLQDPRVNPADYDNYAIRYASLYKQIKMVKLLLNDERVKKKLPKKEINKYEEQIKSLNESVKDFLKPKSTEDILRDLGDLTPNEMLIKSAKNGFVEGVKLALERGVDPSVDDNYVIKVASSKGYTEVVKLLLQDPRIDPSADNNFAIRWSSRHGQTEIVKLLLLNKRVDPSVWNNRPIRYATNYKHVKVVKLLLEDPRVKEKLTKDEINFFKKRIEKYSK